jgi:hypothetical protein
MTNAAVIISNELTTEQTLDIVFKGTNKVIRKKLAAKGTGTTAFPSTVDVGDITSAEELNAHPDFRRLLDASPVKVSVAVVRGTNDIASPSIIVDASGTGVRITQAFDFAALVTGAADDVPIWVANFPFVGKLIGGGVFVKTVVAANTLQLRRVAGGGGGAANALSNAMSSAAVGLIPNTFTGIATDGVPPVLAINDSIYLRRSDRAAAGTVIMDFLRTA